MTKEPRTKIEKSTSEPTANTEKDNLSSADSENIKLLLESVNEIKNSIHKLEESILDIASKLNNLENRFDIESNCKNVQIQYDSEDVNNKIYSPKDTTQELNTSTPPENNRQMPIMPGAGFACITADYLRSLSKNRQD